MHPVHIAQLNINKIVNLVFKNYATNCSQKPQKTKRKYIMLNLKVSKHTNVHAVQCACGMRSKMQ